MRQRGDRTVYRRPDGSWANQRKDAGRPTSLHWTREAAIEAARKLLLMNGGGELTIDGADEEVREDEDTEPHKGPPCPVCG
jgi:hypothetical protein